MARPFRFTILQPGRVWRMSVAGAGGLAGAIAAADRASACEGFGCVGDAVERGMHDTGVALRRTGRVLERGAHGVGTTVEKGVNATGRAVGQAARDTSKAVSGQP